MEKMETKELGPKLATEIYETDNYKMFVVDSHNRPVGRTVGLELSMATHGFWSSKPIIVRELPNGDLLVIDGHRRLLAAFRTGTPVKYVIEKANISRYEVETTKVSWSLKQWLDSHADAGNHHYQYVRKYQAETKIPLSICYPLFLGNVNPTALDVLKFKKGDYVIADKTLANVLGDMVQYCRKREISFATSRGFVKALAYVIKIKEVNINVLKQKIKSHPHLMKVQGTVEQYCSLLEEVYNYHNKEKVNIAFKAKELAHQARQGKLSKAKQTLSEAPHAF